MSRPIRTVWDLEQPGRDLEPNSTRIPELLAFAAIPLAGVVGPAGLPLNELAAAAIVALAILRRPRGATRRPRWFALGILAIPAIITAATLADGLQPAKRLAHLALWAALAMLLSSGRIHTPSAARGLGIGLLLNGAAYLVGAQTGGYAGRFTGLVGDPNAAAFYLVVLGSLAVAFARSAGWRAVLIPSLIAMILLTQSRTGWLALATVGLWWVLARRLSTPVVAVLGTLAFVAVSRLSAEQFDLPIFQGREGSDALRERLLVLETAKIAVDPLLGGGAGTATVRIGEGTMFFHSSYLAVRQEGGWVTLIVLLATVVATLLLATRVTGRRNPLAEAALPAVMVIAINLGEVWLELPTAIALGMLIWHWRSARDPAPVRVAPVRPPPRALAVRAAVWQTRVPSGEPG